MYVTDPMNIMFLNKFDHGINKMPMMLNTYEFFFWGGMTKCSQAWTRKKNKRIEQTRKHVLDIGFRYTSKSHCKIKNDFYKRIVEIRHHVQTVILVL